MSDETPSGEARSIPTNEIRDVIAKRFTGDARPATVEDIANIYAILADFVSIIPELLGAASLQKLERKVEYLESLQASAKRLAESIGKNIVDLSNREGGDAPK